MRHEKSFYSSKQIQSKAKVDSGGPCKGCDCAEVGNSDVLEKTEGLKYKDPQEMLTDLYETGRDIMARKNHDYRGGSGDPYANFRGSVQFDIDPIIGIMLRMQDKMMRIKTFVEKGELKVKNEGIKDALVDITNYTALIWGIINESETKP